MNTGECDHEWDQQREHRQCVKCPRRERLQYDQAGGVWILDKRAAEPPDRSEQWQSQ